MIILQQSVSQVQRDLDDEDATVWSYDEIASYLQDGYDNFCALSKCLFDMFVIENVPPTGNWSTDLEKYQAEQRPGFGLTDGRIHFTAEHERDIRVGGNPISSLEGPTRSTDGAGYEASNLPSKVSTGRLPDSTIDVLRITWDELELFPEDSASLKRMDSQYEQREEGDPRHYTIDKDGVLTVRLIPPARGDAEYPTVVGSWGTMTHTTKPDVTVVGSYGILRSSDGAFPSGGPHGTPTRRHPAAKNIVVELIRQGRPLSTYPFEIPDAYVKYVNFWAMSRALKEDGPGQDIKLSKHYRDRFDMGVDSAIEQLRKVQKEFVLRMGSAGDVPEPFAMGDPQLPYPFGPTGRKIP